MGIISWIHVSDLHFEEPLNWDASVVLRSLVKDIAKLPTEIGVRANFVVVSGDIASHGKREEYSRATQFFNRLLDVTGINADRLFIVPGNHDVDRLSVTSAASQLQKKLRTRAVVNKVLMDPGKRSMLFERLQNYASFVSSYFGGSRFFDREWIPKPVSFVIGGVTVFVSCLNSAWLSREKQEKNKLCVGEHQARSASETVENAKLRIGVLHHPLHWLAEFDRLDVEPILLKGYDFVLHGHVHIPEFLRLISPDYDTMVVGAGAAYETRLYRNNYNIVSLDTDTGRGVIFFRGYSDRQAGFWSADSFAYGGAPDGGYKFKLSSDLKGRLKPKVIPTPVGVDFGKIYSSMSQMTKPQLDVFILRLRGRMTKSAKLKHLGEDLDPDNIPSTKRECLLYLLNTLGKTSRAMEELLDLLQEQRPDVYGLISKNAEPEV